MTRRDLSRALLLIILLASVALRGAVALGNTNVETGACSVATAGSANVTATNINCIFGFTSDQVKELIEAAARGATSASTSTIVELSKQLSITEDATKSLLRIVGEQDVPLERLSETLNRVANDYKHLQAQVKALNLDNPTARGLVDRAKAEIAAGHFADAHQLLAQARQAQIAAFQEAQKLQDQAQAAVEAGRLGAAAAAAAEGDLAITELHYMQAADLFKQAQELVPAGHTSQRAAYIDQRADALYRQGADRGDNAALQQAIDIQKLVLQDRPRDLVPLDWAMTQGNLGNALERLGERESGTARLEEAVEAERAALEEYRRDRDPLNWAATQMNLGNALTMLGERERGTTHLEQAVAADRAALEEEKRDRVPLAWAMTQNNLGIALWRLGERESGTVRLEEAVVAYRAALEEGTRDRVPFRWAMTETNLGAALQKLGERESGTARTPRGNRR